MKKLRLGVLFLFALIALLTSCQEDWVDDCSIPQDEIDHPPADAVPYTITNQSCITISTFYIAPRKCDYWGVSWMGMDVLWPGDSYTVYVPAGRYDFHFEDATGVEYFMYNEKVKADGEFPIVNADGSRLTDCHASVTIVNHSKETISGFYIDRDGGKNWLGQDTIAPGESFQFLMFPATIDIKVTKGLFDEIYLAEEVVVDHHLTVEVTGD